MKKHSRIICSILILALILAVPVSAEENTVPRASAFFAIHDCYLYKTDSSTFQICFDVTATGTMRELGVSSIEVDRSANGVNWSLIRTYEAEDYPQMLCENTGSHDSYVTYRYATPGYYYRAYITFYAKNSSGTGELFRYTATLRM